MVIGYEHATPWGVFRILLSGGRWTIFSDEERLGDYATAIQALDALLRGHTLRDGRDTSRMDLPAQISDWTIIEV